MPDKDTLMTHFGFEQIAVEKKNQRVNQVFESVAPKYDLMNDLMSLGIHRIWKRIAVDYCGIRQGQIVLDCAGGSGDLTRLIKPLVGENGKIFLVDINSAMLNVGRQRLLDRGIFKNTYFIQANAEQLPFQDNQFDRIIIGFGLRNITHPEKALLSFYRILKPGGRLIILEFSKPMPTIKPIYDIWSFQVLPRLGQWIADDSKSYQYLAESIRMHPDQQTLLMMMKAAGFDQCDYYNYSMGIVAIHRGTKF